MPGLEQDVSGYAANAIAARGDNAVNLSFEPDTNYSAIDLNRSNQNFDFNYAFGRVLGQELDQSDVVIGLTKLRVPPQQISVETISKSEVMPALRSTTSSLVKTGREQIRIDIQAVFPDIASANRELRELVAQFRLSPVLPLESKYVANAVIQKKIPVESSEPVDNTKLQEEYEQETLELTNQLKSRVRSMLSVYSTRLPGEALVLLTNLNNITYSPNYSNINDIAHMIEQLEGLSSAVKNSLRDGDITNTFLTDLRDVLDLYARVHVNYQRAEVYKVKANTPDSGLHEYQTVVPVILNAMTVTTLPENPETFVATISLLYFNYAPYSQYFEFKGPDGLPVESIVDCPWYERFVETALSVPETIVEEIQAKQKTKRHLKQINPEDRGYLGFRYPTTQLLPLEQAVGDNSTHTTQSVRVTSPYHSDYFTNVFDTPVILDGTRTYTNEYNDFFIRSTDRNIIVQGISVGLQNRVAVQPVASSTYPTAQYVGGMNAMISVDIKVVGETQQEHDEAVAALQSMKREVERVSVMYGPRARRDSKIFIANDVINLMGVSAVQLQDLVIQTDPDHPMCSDVTMTMIEYTSSQVRREVLEQTSDGIAANARVALEYGAARVSEFTGRVRGNYTLNQFINNYQNTDGDLTVSQAQALEGAINKILYRDAAIYAAETEDRYAQKAAFNLLSNSDFTTGLRQILLIGSSIESLERFVKQQQRITEHATGVAKLVSEALALYASSQLERYIDKRNAPDDLGDALYNAFAGRIAPAGQAVRVLHVSSPLDRVASYAAGQFLQETGVTDRSGDFIEGYSKFVNAGTELANLVPVKILVAAILKDPSLVSIMRQGAFSFEVNVSNYAKQLLAAWAGLGPVFEDGLVPVGRSPSTIMRSNIIAVIEDLETTGRVILPDYAEGFDLPTTADLQKVYNAIEWLKANIKEFSQLLIRERDKYSSDTAHPDLSLPTYGEIYIPVWKALVDSGAEPGLLDDGFDLDSCREDVKAFIRRFVPIYGDLGVKAPEGKSRTSFARSLSDEVEPGFFWYHTRTLDEDASVYTTYAARNASRERENVPKSQLQNGVVFDATGIRRTSSNTTDPRVRDLQNGITHVIADTGQLDSAAAQRLESMLYDNLERRADDFMSMRRFFPAFKLYFLEPGVQSIGFVDDLYGYNSILGIKVHRHVFYPDTVELDLLNVSGNLDAMSGKIESIEQADQRKLFNLDRPGILNNTGFPQTATDLRQLAQDRLNPTVTNVLGRPAKLEQLFLREGTMMVLKMGYTNRPSEMETVFTGQVAELTNGDVMHIVGQSYAVQLTVPLHAKNLDGALRVGHAVMDDPAVVHFGQDNILNPTRESLARARARRARDGADPNDSMFQTRKLDNFHLGGLDAERGWFTRGWFGAMQDLRFQIPNRTGLETLHELARHHPGIVCSVRPYDNHATLFVGFPSQDYRYTDDGLEEELLAQEEIRKGEYENLTQSEQAARDAAVALMGKFAGQRQIERPREFSRWVSDPAQQFLDTTRTYWTFGLDVDLTNRPDEDRSYVSDWNNLSEKLTPAGMKAFVRTFYNDLHWLVDTGHQEYEPVLFRIADRQGSRLYIEQEFERLFNRAAAGLEASVNDVIGQPFVYDTANYGNAFVNIPAWENMSYQIMQLTGRIKETDIASDILMHETDFRGIEDWRTKAFMIARGARAFRTFVHAFNEYLDRQVLVGDTTVLALIRGLDVYNERIRTEKPKGLRPFRQFHWVDSYHHLIKNNMRASTDQMANTINVRYPKDQTDVLDGNEDQGYLLKSDVNWHIKEIKYHKDLRPQDKKVRTTTEICADHEDRAIATGTSTLATAISEMYRGELVLQGNPAIQPYDVIFLFDFYNMVFGPVEVEAVTHVFMPDTGFASIVQPRALVAPGHTLDRKQIVGEAAIAMRFMEDIHVKVVDRVVRSLPDYMKGDETEDEDDSIYKPNVTIYPLSHNGRPWLAGLRGPDRSWQTMDIDGRFELYETAQAAILRQQQLQSHLPNSRRYD